MAAVLLASTGCLFNLFQTARMLGSGNVSLTVGTGVMNIAVEDNANWNLTPQARLAVGLSDKIDLGFQTGALVPLSTGDFGWLGVKGDLKFSILDDPESFSLAMGVGGGYSVEFLNWGVFGEVLFSANTFPVFLVYQPTLPIEAEGFVIRHHVAGGVALPISDTATVFLSVDVAGGVVSFGLALEVGF